MKILLIVIVLISVSMVCFIACRKYRVPTVEDHDIVTSFLSRLDKKYSFTLEEPNLTANDGNIKEIKFSFNTNAFVLFRIRYVTDKSEQNKILRIIREVKKNDPGLKNKKIEVQFLKNISLQTGNKFDEKVVRSEYIK